MALKTFKPTTPTKRHTVLLDRKKLTKKAPEKNLTKKINYKAARNNQGRVSVRHKGGRVKRKYRVIDFKRDKRDIVGKVETVEYDPNRSANIALILYPDGERRYILSPRGLKIGDEVSTGEEVEVKVGNAMPLKKVPSGMMVHSVELKRNAGAQICRSAGTAAQVQGGDKGYVQLKMPSGEIRLVHGDNYATIGEVGNEDHSNVKLGKAGRKRYKGIRPSVRGMAMYPKQHPHGGGEGKGVIGRYKKDLWGNRADVKTRKNKRTNKFIIKRRTTKQRPKDKKLN